MSLYMQITRGAELPDRTLTWEDASGPVDFAASPHTFRLEIPFPTPLVKTAGITGSAAGLVTITFTTDETGTWPPGSYAGRLWAKRTSDNKDREPVRILVVVL